MEGEEGESSWPNMQLLTAMVGVGDYAEGSADLNREVEAVLTDSRHTSRSRVRSSVSGRRARSEPPSRSPLETVLEESGESREERNETARGTDSEQAQEAPILVEEHQPRTGPDCPLIDTPNDRGVLSEWQRDQILLYYSGLRSRVFVGGSTAALFADSRRTLRPTVTGAPVIVSEIGRRLSPNRVWLFIVEVGTGIPYFKELLSYRTGYTRITAQFYVFSPSWNRGSQAALSFKAAGPAYTFSLYVVDLMSRLENIGVPISQPKRPVHRRKRPKQPSKSEISQPCCFIHVTSVKPSDSDRFRSMRFVRSAPGAFASDRSSAASLDPVRETRNLPNLASDLRNDRGSDSYLDDAQILNTSTGRNVARLRETAAENAPGRIRENLMFPNWYSQLALTVSRARDTSLPATSWYNPFADQNSQVVTSEVGDAPEFDERADDDASTEANTTEDIDPLFGFDRASNRYRSHSSTRTCFRELTELPRHPRASNPLNRALTMDTDDAPPLPSLATSSTRSQPGNQPLTLTEIDASSNATVEANSRPVSRRSDPTNQPLTLTEINESNGITLEEYSRPASRRSDPQNQPPKLTEINESNGITPVANSGPFAQPSEPTNRPPTLMEILSSIQAEARSLADPGPVSQSNRFKQPHTIDYQNANDATDSPLGPYTLGKTLFLDFKFSSESNSSSLGSSVQSDSPNEPWAPEILRSGVQTLAEIQDSGDGAPPPIFETPDPASASALFSELPSPALATLEEATPARARIRPETANGGSSSEPTAAVASSDFSADESAILLDARPGELMSIDDPRLSSLRQIMDLAFPEGRRDDLFDSLAATATASAADFSDLPLPDPPRNSPQPPEEPETPEEDLRQHRGRRPKTEKRVTFLLEDS